MLNNRCLRFVTFIKIEHVSNYVHLWTEMNSLEKPPSWAEKKIKTKQE